MSIWKRRQLLLAMVGVSLILGGCGKKGPLEPPVGSPDAPKAKAASESGAGVPSLKGGAKRPPPIKPPKEPFILDGLL